MSTIRNLEYIRGLSTPDLPDIGAKLYEALQDIITQQTAIAQQTNANPHGQVAPPPGVSKLVVSSQNGHFSAAIFDNNPLFRDVHYYLEHADNPSFTNPQIIHLGHSRNHTIFLGNVTRYWRAYSAYANSGPGPAQYHGGSIPAAVRGGGIVAGPAFAPSQGSGTGQPGQGLTGPGVTPFRSPTNTPPTRQPLTT